jgi:hypothetical protein
LKKLEASEARGAETDDEILGSLAKRVVSLMKNVKHSLEVQLKESVSKYLASHDYVTASRGRLGRAWRCMVVSKKMYISTFHLLKQLEKLKCLTVQHEDSLEATWWDEDASENQMTQSETEKTNELKGAFLIAIKSHELRKSMEEDSTKLITMFRSLGNIAIKAGRMTKDVYATYQHKAKILEESKQKRLDRTEGDEELFKALQK